MEKEKSHQQKRLIESMAPGIISRRSVHEPYKQVYLRDWCMTRWTWCNELLVTVKLENSRSDWYNLKR
jgi:hypothetical protein